MILLRKKGRHTAQKKARITKGELIHQFPYKRTTKGWKRWVGVPNFEKYAPNKLSDEQAHYMIDNKRKILQ